MKRDRILYKESYRAGRVKFNDHDTLTNLQRMDRLSKGRVSECECSAAGRIERNGEVFEFVDIRVFVKPYSEG